MNHIPEGRGTSPAGALVEASPIEAARDSNPGSAVPGRVVHCKREAFDVYIGRPSTFGNPWRVLDERSREHAIAAFENYARRRIADSPSYADGVKGLHGKTLGCWCAPKRCHGEVLLKLADEMMRSASTRTTPPTTKGKS